MCYSALPASTFSSGYLHTAPSLHTEASVQILHLFFVFSFLFSFICFLYALFSKVFPYHYLRVFYLVFALIISLSLMPSSRMSLSLCIFFYVFFFTFVIIFFFVHCVFTLTTWPQHLVGTGRSRLRFICVAVLQFFVFLFSFGWSFSTHFFSGPWSSSSPRGTNRLPCHLVFFLRLYISMSFQVLV